MVKLNTWILGMEMRNDTNTLENSMLFLKTIFKTETEERTLELRHLPFIWLTQLYAPLLIQLVPELFQEWSQSTETGMNPESHWVCALSDIYKREKKKKEKQDSKPSIPLVVILIRELRNSENICMFTFTVILSVTAKM